MQVKLRGPAQHRGVLFFVGTEISHLDAVFRYNQEGVGVYGTQSEVEMDTDDQHAGDEANEPSRVPRTP